MAKIEDISRAIDRSFISMTTREDNEHYFVEAGYCQTLHGIVEVWQQSWKGELSIRLEVTKKRRIYQRTITGLKDFATDRALQVYATKYAKEILS